MPPSRWCCLACSKQGVFGTETNTTRSISCVKYILYKIAAITLQEWLVEVARLDSSSKNRRSAMVALRRIKSPLVRPISLLVIARETENQNLRETAIRCLGEVGNIDDIEILESIRDNEQIARFGRQAANNALNRLIKSIDLSSKKANQEIDIKPENKYYNDKYFDVAISFAGEDRYIAKTISYKLREKSLQVFYDEFYQSDLIGEDLARLLAKIYSSSSLFCIVLLSKSYPQKKWPKFELSNALEREVFGDSSYIIPVRIDSTRIDGISEVIGYIDLRESDISMAVDHIAEKVRRVRSGIPRLFDRI